MCVFHVENVFLFHRKCIRVDAPDKDGWTPLELAAREGCTEAFAKLLKKADVGRVDNQLKIVVLLAVERAGHSAILEVSCTYMYIPLLWCDINITAGCQSKISRLLETT